MLISGIDAGNMRQIMAMLAPLVMGMLGKNQRWQNGFDCQGLWVEVEVEKELGFTTFIVESAAPFDAETARIVIEEIKPVLERA